MRDSWLVKLADALKASKQRIALATIYEDGDVACWLRATDASVTIVSKAGIIERTWADVLPREHSLVLRAQWEPHDPLSPLQQLADALTDWSDD